MNDRSNVFLTVLLSATLFAAFPSGIDSGRETGEQVRLLDRLQTDLHDKAYDDALTTLDKLMELDPANHQLHNLRAVVKDRMGRYSEARQSYLKALELQPTSSTVRLNFAFNALRLERYAEAASEFGLLVEQDSASTPPPSNPYQQAPVGAELERFARTLKPEEAQFSSLGRLFLRHHLPEAAATVFSVGTQLLPRSAPLHFGLGWSYHEMGKFQEAQGSLRRALGLQPDYLECCVRLGYSYFTADKLDEATETYRDCVRMKPDSYAGHYFLGTALLRGESPNVQEATVHLEQAVALNPYSFDSHLQLGKAYVAKGAYPQALREFSIVAQENPENEEAQYRLGMLYKQLNQEEEARKYLMRFETLKARENSGMRDQIISGPIALPPSAIGKVADDVVAFYAGFKKALAQETYGEIWYMLTDRSKALYHDDPKRFRETLSHLDPALIDRMIRSSISGGKLVAGRIVCDLQAVDGISFPPLILIQDGGKLKIDYAFDLSLAGLAYLGARNGP